MSIKKVIQTINKNKSFLITSHVGLEGDALGGALGLAYLLKRKKKDVVIINEDPVPRNYKFLDNKALIKPLDAKIKRPDAAFILDCSDFSRCGKVANIIPKDIPLVVIDHHISNLKFADINWVESKSSSTGEMIYKLFKKMNVAFDRKSALCLYTAMLTDTGSFRFSMTSSYTHAAVAELIKFNIDANKVYQHIYESNSYEDMMILRKSLNTLKVDTKYKIAWFKINKDIAAPDIHSNQSENILDFARSIKDVEVCFLLKSTTDKNRARVNLRSKGKIDVSKIAHFFGGGGHKNASGCTIRSTIGKAEKDLLREIKKAIKKRIK